MFGKPDRTENSRKQSVWYYKNEKNNITIYWNNRTATVEKCYFSTLAAYKTAWDHSKANMLRSGETSLQQAIKLLGAPKDMTIKSTNQELHYAFENSVLNLFFRNGTLVNYTVY